MTKPIRQLKTYARLHKDLPKIIRAARENGHTWKEIHTAAGMSRAAAINTANRQPRDP